MKLDESAFIYNATLKLAELPRTTARAVFPGVADISVNSRSFSTYSECVNSAKVLIDDIVKDVNAQAGVQFTVSAEVNPTYTGVPTRSNDWVRGEVSRFWIFDEQQVGAQQIHAVGQARIFSVGKAKPKFLD